MLKGEGQEEKFEGDDVRSMTLSIDGIEKVSRHKVIHG